MITLYELIHDRELRVHGNGFIQCDIDDTRRMHFWGNNLIPRQKVDTPIHDHAFSFESQVLLGQIINVTLQEQDGSDYEVYVAEARDGEETALHTTNHFTNLFASSVRTYAKGDTYRIMSGQMHDIHVYVPTVTVITKLDAAFYGSMEGARVLVPWNVKPDNDFRRDAFPQEELRNMIYDIAAADFAVGE